MMMKKHPFLFIMGAWLWSSCTHELRCARFYIPADFVGKMTLRFNKNDGQNEVDKDGCVVYRVSEKGECRTIQPFVQGYSYPHKTFRFFLVSGRDSVIEIPEFFKSEYMGDPFRNGERKYVFFRSSGFEDPDDVVVYYVDWGKNFKRY
jgi:hypothetical protein